MIVFPAIDLKDGQCVRLYKGDFTQKTVVNQHPLEQACYFEKAGAKALHLVDLDGALTGENPNQEIIRAIRSTLSIPIQVGGGIRTFEQIDAYLEMGINQVIIGSKAVEDPGFVKEAVKLYGEKIIVGIDAIDGFVATHGWKNVSSLSYLDAVKEMTKLGVETIIYTDISRDGTLVGPNLDQLKEIQELVPNVKLIASGGIGSRADLDDVAELDVYGVISGKALYSDKISMTDVVEVTHVS